MPPASSHCSETDCAAAATTTHLSEPPPVIQLSSELTVKLTCLADADLDDDGFGVAMIGVPFCISDCSLVNAVESFDAELWTLAISA